MTEEQEKAVNEQETEDKVEVKEEVTTQDDTTPTVDFEALNSKIDEITEYVRDEFAKMNDAMSLFVKNGGIVRENNSDNISKVVDSEAPDTSAQHMAEVAAMNLDEMDFKIK